MNQYQSENITDLAKSLLNVQRTVQPVTKDAENPFTKSWYASLNSVMRVRLSVFGGNNERHEYF